MATLQDFKTQMKYVNILGIANLAEKGVELPDDATTYEIMQRIIDIPSGGNDTKEIEVLIDESGILEEGEYTLTEKVQQLIDIIKKYQDDNPESVVIENILTTSEDYILTDKDGLYITTKESE